MSLDKSLSVTIQWKPRAELCCGAVCYTVQGSSSFESMDAIIKCIYSHELSYSANVLVSGCTLTGDVPYKSVKGLKSWSVTIQTKTSYTAVFSWFPVYYALQYVVIQLLCYTGRYFKWITNKDTSSSFLTFECVEDIHEWWRLQRVLL